MDSKFISEDMVQRFETDGFLVLENIISGAVPYNSNNQSESEKHQRYWHAPRAVKKQCVDEAAPR